MGEESRWLSGLLLCLHPHTSNYSAWAGRQSGKLDGFPGQTRRRERPLPCLRPSPMAVHLVPLHPLVLLHQSGKNSPVRHWLASALHCWTVVVVALIAFINTHIANTTLTCPPHRLIREASTSSKAAGERQISAAAVRKVREVRTCTRVPLFIKLGLVDVGGMDMAMVVGLGVVDRLAD